MIINHPVDVIIRTGSIATFSCGFVNESANVQPLWNIIMRDDDGDVISDMNFTTAEINSDNNMGNEDDLVYIADGSSGPLMSPNSRLRVGPVDQTFNQSSYQCIFELFIFNISIASNIGTLTVIGEYRNT